MRPARVQARARKQRIAIGAHRAAWSCVCAHVGMRCEYTARRESVASLSCMRGCECVVVSVVRIVCVGRSSVGRDSRRNPKQEI